MPKVTVTGKPIDTLTSTETIDSELLKKTPSGNGNISERLEILPGVQLSENHNNSRSGGEIEPTDLSISGGRSADNNYIFDGSSISSSLDPDFTGTHNYDNIPGHSQRLFLLDHLVDEISVLKANIPASYGDFTGGVVEIKSINPEPEFTGEISYRTTRSDWGQFYLDPDSEEDFYNSTSGDDQPSFVKHETSTTLHIPINNEMGFLFDYSRLESSIPITGAEQKKVQRRRNENFFLKFVNTPKTDTEIHISATYAPYVEDRNLEKTLNSDYKLKGGGYSLTGGGKKKTKLGQLDFNINYQESQNSREAPNAWYSWKITPSKDWGTTTTSSHEGGYGDLEKYERSISTKFDFNFKKLDFKKHKHSFNAGSELSYLQGTYDRTEEFTQYIAYLADGSASKYPILACSIGDPLCIEGEQFIYYKNVRPINKAKADIFNIHTYIEDQIEINKLSIRPGIRVSYENYQKNLNFAPRFAAAYDFFGNQKTIFKGGYNRYYGSDLLTLELKSQQAQATKSFRCVDDGTGSCDYSAVPRYSPDYDWLVKTETSVSTSRVSDLKTPYSDELTLGITQSFFGGELELLYIDREYKDQIITVTLDTIETDDLDYKYSEWRNSGRRSHEELSLSWQKSGKNYFVSFNVTWEETKSNSSSYLDSFAEHQIDDETNDLDLPVWYEGKLTSLNNVPTNDYNRPYKASLIYTAKLPYNFAFTNVTNFRSRYQVVERISSGNVVMPNGSIVDVKTLDNDYYDKVTKPSDLTFDWKFSWASPEWSNNSVTFTLDIYNVFNRKVEIGTEDDEYKLGRQFWAGLTYKF